MSQNKFPPLTPDKLNPTHNTIRGYAQVLGKVRRALTPKQKHWWHVSLRAAVTGLTTTPVPAGDFTFEMMLDFTTHQLVIKTSQGEEYRTPLRGQSVATFCEDTLAAQIVDFEFFPLITDFLEVEAAGKRRRYSPWRLTWGDDQWRIIWRDAENGWPLGMERKGLDGVGVLTAVATRQRARDALLMPVSVILMSAIAARSIRWRYTGGPRWKGRVAR